MGNIWRHAQNAYPNKNAIGAHVKMADVCLDQYTKSHFHTCIFYFAIHVHAF